MTSMNACALVSGWATALYTNRANRLNYSVGGEVLTLSHLDEKMYVLGFLPREDRVYLCNKTLDVFSYSLLTSVLNYQTAILRKDFDEANELLPAIPEDHLDAISTFLESQGYKGASLGGSRRHGPAIQPCFAIGQVGESARNHGGYRSRRRRRCAAEMEATG